MPVGDAYGHRYAKIRGGSSGYDPEKIKECAMEWLMVALELAVALIIALAVYLTIKK